MFLSRRTGDRQGYLRKGRGRVDKSMIRIVSRRPILSHNDDIAPKKKEVPSGDSTFPCRKIKLSLEIKTPKHLGNTDHG